jgi:hypothetical protein
MANERHDEIAAAMRAMVAARGVGKTICPSEVARAVAPEAWRELMEEVRAVARGLARAGEVVVTQQGVVLDPAGEWRGAVRVGLVG